MTTEKTEKLKNEKFFKTIRILGNILFVPFILIILISSILMYSAKIRNEVPSLFGYSAVKILTGSMEPEFKVNDVVIVKQVNARNLSVGDVIAFYDYMDTDVDTQDLEDNIIDVVNNDRLNNKTISIASFFGGGATNDNQKLAAQSYSKVIFHRIVNISTPTNPDDENYGKLFFQTQGDANNTADEHWIMEDFVVGVYINNNSVIGLIFNFCTTPIGTTLLILVPSLILLIILIINLIGEYKKYKQEKENLLLETEQIKSNVGISQNQQLKNVENTKTVKDEQIKNKDSNNNQITSIANKNNNNLEDKQKLNKTENVELNKNDKAKTQDANKKLLPKKPTTNSTKSQQELNKQDNSAKVEKTSSNVNKKLPPKVPPKPKPVTNSTTLNKNEKLKTDKNIQKNESNATDVAKTKAKLPPKKPPVKPTK